MKRFVFSILSLVALLTLPGCSGAKDQLGLTRKPPDEFAVVRRAPLAMPPGYELRPPVPGAPRPQETTPGDQARQVVFGDVEPIKPVESSTEELFLKQAGALSVDPEIRATVDKESTIEDDSKKPVVKRLLNIGGGGEPSATIVNAPKEAERLQKNAEEGKPVTEGESPSIED